MPDRQIHCCPSPNQGPRRDGLRPRLIVLHYTAMQSAAAAIDRLCDPTAEVSAHYLIAINGVITQMVPEEMRAWHAGKGSWAGQDDINSRSIGIELDNNGRHPFPEPQMQALETLMNNIMTRWDIPPTGVIGHSDMAPGRKVDPGPHFDWGRLARIGHAEQNGDPKATKPCTAQSFRNKAQAVGYSEPTDNQTLLNTVRLRHRPFAKGPLTPEDEAALPNR